MVGLEPEGKGIGGRRCTVVVWWTCGGLGGLMPSPWAELIKKMCFSRMLLRKNANITQTHNTFKNATVAYIIYC